MTGRIRYMHANVERRRERTMTSIKNTVRLAGFLILLIAILSPFSILYLPSTLIVPGDAATTASNVMASEGLFRLGIVVDSVVVLLEIVVIAILYVLLRPVNRTLALVAALARLAMTIVMAVNVFNSLGVLLLLGDSEYLTVFEPDQLHTLVLLVLNLHESGVYVWQVFFGLHWVAVGYLVFKSDYFPRILGILLMVTCLGYLMDSFGILYPSSGPLSTVASVVLAVGVIGELSFTLWLLIKGVNVEQWEIRAHKSA
jgi:Domain of unknown function (DUF4386)